MHQPGLYSGLGAIFQVSFKNGRSFTQNGCRRYCATIHRVRTGSTEKAEMNWQRGLLRLWIVGTAIWVFFVTWAIGPVERFQRLSDPVRFSANQVQLEFPGNTDVSVVKHAVAKWAEEQPEKTGILAGTENDAAKAAETIVGSYQPKTISGIAMDWAFAALLPPLVIISLGVVFGWALMGFKPRT
jgi:hypothetical protein